MRVLANLTSLSFHKPERQIKPKICPFSAELYCLARTRSYKKDDEPLLKFDRGYEPLPREKVLIL